MPALTRDGDVFVLDIGADENRFHPDWMTAVSGHLDEVAAVDGPRALVTTATGKFFSNGLDLDWLGEHHDALAGGLVDAVGDEDTLLANAVEHARPLAAKHGPTLGTIKRRMYARELKILLGTSGNPFG